MFWTSRYCVMNGDDFFIFYNGNVLQNTKKKGKLDQSATFINKDNYLYFVYKRNEDPDNMGLYMDISTGNTGFIDEIQNKTMVDEHLIEKGTNILVTSYLRDILKHYHRI